MNAHFKPRITKPGIFPGIPLAQYHMQLCDGPSVSSSDLRTVADKSPAHFWCYSSLNPDRLPKPETEAMTLGRAAHHLLLGEDDFSTAFIARPDKVQGEAWHGNRTVCKAWLEAQHTAGRTVLKPEQIERIRGMAKALASHPLIRAGILNGDIEQSMFARDKATGLWLKARPDAVPNDSGDYADLKLTTSVDYYDLAKTIAEYNYHQQGALVGRVHKEITKRQMTSFSLVFVESTPPHCVRVVTLKDCDLARGSEQNDAALSTIAECLKSGVWPGPGDYRDADFIELPKWKQDQIDERLKYFTAETKKPSAADYLGAG